MKGEKTTTSMLKSGAVVAAFAIVSIVADAGTIAWYHFDEVAAGTRLVSGDSVLNATGATACRFVFSPFTLSHAKGRTQ